MKTMSIVVEYLGVLRETVLQWIVKSVMPVHKAGTVAEIYDR